MTELEHFNAALSLTYAALDRALERKDWYVINHFGVHYVQWLGHIPAALRTRLDESFATQAEAGTRALELNLKAEAKIALGDCGHV